MAGTTLYPLNRLKEEHPDLYEKQAGKYKGRERLMTRRIERLDCLWNDVLFLTAVHPCHIRELKNAVGLANTKPLRSYRFDADTLDPALLEVRFHRRGQMPVYEPYDPARMLEYRVFWRDSERYCREALRKGAPLMLFGHVPHILYKGTLDVSQAEIVEA